MTYDVWLQWSLTEKCNLRCEYCSTANRQDAAIPVIDIVSMVRTLDETAKTFKVTFTGGGEPFLVPNLVDACVELTKKHYVSFNTNLTSNRIEDLAERVDPTKVERILASLHIQELRKRNALKRYAEYYLLLKERRFSISAVEVAYPALLSEIANIRKELSDMGIDIKFTPFIGTHNGKTYPDAYTQSELEVFGISSKVNRHYRSTMLCNAGHNVGYVTPDGNIVQCLGIKKCIGHIYDHITFKDTLLLCPYKSCICPVSEYNTRLYLKAVSELRHVDIDTIPLFTYRTVSYIYSKYYAINNMGIRQVIKRLLYS